MKKLCKLSLMALLFALCLTASAFADYNKGVKAHKVKNYPLAYKEILASARKGHLQSIITLASFYNTGTGTKKDVKKAAYWDKIAADNGVKLSQLNMGIKYQIGSGVPKNMVLAAKYYQLSADQGVAQAQVNLGALYLDGIGVPQDRGKAFALFMSAAKLGNINGIFNVANSHRHGYGTPVNYAEAIKWYKKATQAGDKTADAEIEAIYASGVIPRP